MGAPRSQPPQGLQNFTNAVLVYSWNGIDDHFILAPESQMILDVTSNQALGQGAYIAEGVRIYVRQDTLPSTGFTSVSALYGAL
jgi:hypothetical protein